MANRLWWIFRGNLQILVTWLVTSSFVLGAPFPMLQESGDESGLLKISDVVLVLATDNSGGVRAASDLGGVNANRTYQIDFRIQNPLDHDIEFETSRSSCNCTEVKFEQMLIPSRGSIRGTITYKAPDFSKEGKIDFNLLLLSRPQSISGTIGVPKTAVMLHFSAYLRGVIDLGQTSHVFEVRDGIGEYLIPIVITEPITFEDLGVAVSSELKDVSAEVVKTDANISIKVCASKNNLPPNGIAGSVTVSHRPSKTEKVLLLTVKPQLPLRVSPSFLAFSPNNKNDRIVEATAVIRVSRAAAKTGDEKETDSRPANSDDKLHVEPLVMSECRLGEFHLEHELHRLSDSIWKVRFRIAKRNYEQFLESQRKQDDRDGVSGGGVSFRIRVGENQYRMQVNVFEE